MADELRDAEQEAPPTAAEKLGMDLHPTKATPGLSASPGLRELPNSTVPGFTHSHVHGPQQAPVDPVAAGLDVAHHPLTRAENRAITLTGKDGAGGNVMGAEAPNTHETVAAPKDEQPAIGEIQKGE